MRVKLRAQIALNFVLDRMREPSTWQGVGFLCTLAGAKWGAALDWGQAAALGGIVSAFIKTVFPDVLGQKDVV